ncbi:MAG TPA: hypothetical protein VHY36_17540 [Steroidobacteraceae bacterium]|jgi:hypothetical protein|nr:hypothetical protein [Steroidobacteraceae bacterium]
MRRITVSFVVVCSLLLCSVALADAYGDLKKAQAAFLSAKYWHAEEHLPNGRTVLVDFAAPDRWRIQPTPTMTEVLIGNDVYMIQGGRSMKMPMGGIMISKMIKQFEISDDPEVKQSAQDLGTQTLNGRTVHVYSYTVGGVPETIYLGDGSLPVRAVVKNSSATTVVSYSKFNEPITIEAPAS